MKAPHLIPGRWRYANSTDIKAHLGVTGDYPAEGMPAREIAGITVYVAPLQPLQPGQRKRSAHRVRAICPSCQQDMSAGRLHQHSCAKWMR